MFAFHGNINKELGWREAGTYSVDIRKPVDGRWTFYNREVKLKVGDVFYFWTYVLHNEGSGDLGFENLDQTFTVKGALN